MGGERETVGGPQEKRGAVIDIDQPERAITLKSLCFGLLGILLISGLAYFHDVRISSSPPMVGMHLPISGFFYIFVVALLWNGLAVKTIRSLALNAKELMVVTGMTFMGCFPPTSGLFRYFHRMLILPWYYLGTGSRPNWEKFGVLNHIPDKLFPQPVPEMVDGVLQMDDVVYRGFVTGLAQGQENIGLADVPFAAWLPALAYWGPLVLLMSICVMALSLMVHRQWAHHEQLSYPLAQVATAFIHSDKGGRVPKLFRNRLFWWGFVPILLLYALEYLHVWFPEAVPGLSTVFPNLKSWRVDLNRALPVMRVIRAPRLNSQMLYFSVVGIAYFVASDISLTMGLSVISMAFAGILYLALHGVPIAEGGITFVRTGAYLGYALILLYTGRSYYVPIFQKALRFRRQQQADDHAAIMAARLLLASFAGFVLMLMAMGLDWMLALFFSLLLMLLFLVLTRIICETGIPFMQPEWVPVQMLLPLFGPAALGAGSITFMFYLGGILCQDPREALMPYVATSIKMADDANLRVKRIFWLLMVSVGVALGIGFIGAIWTNYNYGSMSGDGFAFGVPRMQLDRAARQISALSETGMLEVSEQAHGLGKLRLIAPDSSAMGFFTFGVLAVVLFSLLRHRFTKFPLHPVLFLVWDSYAAYTTWGSFLLGWGIKCLVVRFGGGKVYQNLKPIFIGLIAGELIAAGLSIFIEMIYYWITGEVAGVRFRILPA